MQLLWDSRHHSFLQKHPFVVQWLPFLFQVKKRHLLKLQQQNIRESVLRKHWSLFRNNEGELIWKWLMLSSNEYHDQFRYELLRIVNSIWVFWWKTWLLSKECFKQPTKVWQIRVYLRWVPGDILCL
jgi:hypothetical protein